MFESNEKEPSTTEFLHYSNQAFKAITDGLLNVNTNNPQTKEKLAKIKNELESEIEADRTQMEKNFSGSLKKEIKAEITNDHTLQELAKEAKRYLENEGRN